MILLAAMSSDSATLHEILVSPVWLGRRRRRRRRGRAGLSSHHLVPLEAVVDQEVSQGVVEVRSEPHQTVGLIRVTDLPEQDVRLLKRPTKHHALLVVDVVVGRPVHHQVLLVGQLLGLGVDVTGLVTSQVVLGGW